MKEKTKKLIFLGTIIFGIFIIIISIAVIVEEVSGAKNFCISIDGEYELHFNSDYIGHLCNSEPISKYADGWFFKSHKNAIFNIGIELP